MFMSGLIWNNDAAEGTFCVPARLQFQKTQRTINRRVVQQIIIDLVEIYGNI
jgi:hypothetical protein